MKRLFLFLQLFVATSIFAQNEKSLLWEISGNGLTKNSYVYGSMHVTDKISYHLSDAFFKHLMEADMVANESDPETWGELNEMARQNYSNFPYNFYTNFYLKPVEKEKLLVLFHSNYNYFNNLLSGVTSMNDDFSEETVLDTFIFQTGKKYNKKTVGLENIIESIIPIIKVREDDAKPEPENITIFKKLTKDQNYFDLLKDLYREKDIVMLDSLNKLIMSKKAHFALIINRNRIMSNSIDSLVKQGSLFAAVGAAHLAGKEGILQLLKDKGYTVQPVFDNFTQTGKKKQKEIESYFPKPEMQLKSTSDGMVKMLLNKFTEEDKEHFGSPDYVNGGVINIKRLPINYFMKKDATQYDHKSLDSLFFENIPGDILDKKFSETSDYKLYDIKNKRKSGNAQRYRFYITPLEIISISMNGVGEYVRLYEKEIFESIQLKNMNNEWETFSPISNVFNVKIPTYNSVNGNYPNQMAEVEIQAYLPQDKSYFFLTERSLNDVNTLENTEFENKQMHFEFLMQHKIDTIQTNYNAVNKSFTSSSSIGNKKIKLKSIINGNRYYLMGTVDATDENTNKFFDSFEITKPKYETNFEILNDTLSDYAVEIPKKTNRFLFLNIDDSFQTKEKNIFTTKYRNLQFNSPSGQVVNLEYFKSHKYGGFENLDSVKVYIKDTYLKKDNLNEFDEEEYSDYDYSDEYYDEFAVEEVVAFENDNLKEFDKSIWKEFIKPEEIKYEFLSENNYFDETQKAYIFEAVVSHPSSTQAIKHKTIYNGNERYTLSTLIDKNYKNDDQFVENVFKTFKPSNEGANVFFENKWKYFLEDVKSEKDTIRYSALNSLNFFSFAKDDVENITNFIDTFDFKESEIDAKLTLISALGEIKNDKVLVYLEKLYKKEAENSRIQFTILEALTKQKSSVAYKKILELLEFETPLTDDRSEINSLFNTFKKDSEFSKQLFPGIFQFYTIEEYKNPILLFCNHLLDKKLVDISALNTNKKSILNDAKLEQKRLLSWKKEQDAKTEEEKYQRYSDNSYPPIGKLNNYLSMLYYYPKDVEINDLIIKLRALDIAELNTELNRLDVIHNRSNKESLTKSLDKIESKFKTALLLLYNNKDEIIPFSDDEMAESAVYNLERLKEKDSIQLLEKRLVKRENIETTFYFYQVIKKVEEGEPEAKELMTIAFVSENGKINLRAYKSFQSEEIIDEVDLPEIKNAIVNEALDKGHNRTNYTILKNQNAYYPGFSDY